MDELIAVMLGSKTRLLQLSKTLFVAEIYESGKWLPLGVMPHESMITATERCEERVLVTTYG